MKSTLSFIFLLFFYFSVSAQNEGWVISTKPGEENKFPVTLANGRIGITVSNDNPLSFGHIVLNGVYDKKKEHDVSCIVKGIVFANLQIKVNGQLITKENMKNVSQTLNMKTASYETSFEYADKLKIKTTVYALYTMPYCGLLDVSIIPLADCDIEVSNKMLMSKSVIEPSSSFTLLEDQQWKMPLQQTLAKTRFKKYLMAATSVFLFETEKPALKEMDADTIRAIGFTQKLKTGKTFSFTLGGSICTGEDFVDPKSEADRMGISLLLRGKKTVLDEHFKAWEQIWKHDIVIAGDEKAQTDVRFMLFNLFSSVRKDSHLSIPPMGLTTQGYYGHVFWDMELWMFPVILAFDHELAETILDYRYDRLQKAKQNALNFGFKGAMFPWESDDSGEEATPTWALTGTFEHHITADVGIACWNYYRVTKNKTWLKEKGYPMLKEIADFWVSHAKIGNDNLYHINNVVGANEFEQNINDNAFTNASAITILRYASAAAKELSIIPDSIWMNVASKICIHHFDNGVTKENETYKGDTVKQADVNLLAYPLNFYTDEKQIKKDLEYYEPIMHPDGPAMSHSVLSVIYSRLGNVDKAYKLFQQAYKPNQRGPFGVFAEAATSNNPYFMTGAGGTLQAVLYGFAGLEITDKGLVQNKQHLPTGWNSITLKGIEVNK